MKPLVDLPRKSRARRSVRSLLADRDAAFRYTDAHSGVYISEHFNRRKVEILLTFERDTKYRLSLEVNAEESDRLEKLTQAGC